MTLCLQHHLSHSMCRSHSSVTFCSRAILGFEVSWTDRRRVPPLLFVTCSCIWRPPVCWPLQKRNLRKPWTLESTCEGSSQGKRALSRPFFFYLSRASKLVKKVATSLCRSSPVSVERVVGLDLQAEGCATVGTIPGWGDQCATVTPTGPGRDVPPLPIRGPPLPIPWPVC